MALTRHQGPITVDIVASAFYAGSGIRYAAPSSMDDFQYSAQDDVANLYEHDSDCFNRHPRQQSQSPSRCLIPFAGSAATWVHIIYMYIIYASAVEPADGLQGLRRSM